MARSKIGFEGGTTGATISTSNQGSTDNPLYFVSIGAGSTLTYDTTHSAHGTKSAKLAPASGQVVSFQYGGNTSGGTLAAASCAVRAYIYMTAAVTAITQIVDLSDLAGAKIARVYLDATGHLYVRDSTSTTLWTATAALPLNQQVRVELYVIPGSTAIHFAYYSADSTTAIASFDTTTAATGANPVAVASVGRLFNTTDTAAWWIDDFAVDTTASAFIGPETNPPPVVSITGNQNVAASSAVTVSVTATDDGSIASYAWTGVRYTTTAASATVTPTSGAATATIAYTASAATTGVLDVWTCVVTDNLGATTTVTTEVRVATTGEILPLRGYAGVGVTVTAVGGAASVGEAMSDSSDTTWAEWVAATGTEQSFMFRLAPSSARSALTGTHRLMQDVAGTLTDKVRLYQGANSTGTSVTQLQEWSFAALTTSAANYTGALTSVAGITDWGNLWLADVEV